MEGLEHEADLLAAQGGAAGFVEAGGGFAAQPEFAGIGRVEQAEDVQQGRLARAGRAGDRQVFALGDVQVDGVETGHLLLAKVEGAADLT
ncbi:hypothetical protein D9M71_231670 [compost metagenome]